MGVIRILSLISCLSVLVLAANSAAAQQVGVQQPVVGITTVRTSVAAPDRGRIFLGGVSSAQSARRQSGLWPRGSSVGLSRSHSSLSASVTIIDLREMDEAILNSVPTQSMASNPQSHSPIRQSTADLSPRQKAARFEQLARQAEERGQLGVAKLYWSMAAKLAAERTIR